MNLRKIPKGLAFCQCIVLCHQGDSQSGINWKVNKPWHTNLCVVSSYKGNWTGRGQNKKKISGFKNNNNKKEQKKKKKTRQQTIIIWKSCPYEIGKKKIQQRPYMGPEKYIWTMSCLKIRGNRFHGVMNVNLGFQHPRLPTLLYSFYIFHFSKYNEMGSGRS